MARLKAEYRGSNDEHITGVPMRDLDSDEFDALPEDRKAALLTTVSGDGKPLYHVVGKQAEMVAAGLAEPTETTVTPARRSRTVTASSSEPVEASVDATPTDTAPVP